MKHTLLFVLGVLLNLPLVSQTTIWTESFETCGNSAQTCAGGNRYTSSSDFYGAASDFFGRIHSNEDFYLDDNTMGNNVHVLNAYTGHDGDYFYAGEDLNDTGPLEGTQDGNDFKDVVFAQIDISNASGLTFRGLFAVGSLFPCGSNDYDTDDFIEVYYDVDGAGEVTALCFNPDLECNIPGDVSNEPLFHDPNCDGDGGEGTALSNTFTEFTFGIPDGNTLDLRIRVRMDAGDEEVAFDNFRVEAITVPVQLTSFEALNEKEMVMLKWSTASEVNNEFFSIEHSSDGENFKEIGTTPGNGTSSNFQNYIYEHHSPSYGINYYRLKQVDFNGDFDYSSIVQANFDKLFDIELYPNPTNGKFEIVNTELNGAEVSILTMSGKLVKKTIIDGDGIDISELTSGLYYVSVLFEGQQFIEKIIKK